MANPLYFDINVHVYGKITEIKNIDPNRYSYIDLLDDITERSLSGLPCNRDCAITLSFQVPESNEKVLVGCDLDVLDMFRFYSRTCLVDLFVELGDGTGLGDFTTPIGPQVDVNGTESVHENHSTPNLWGDDFFGVERAYELNSDGLSNYQSDDEGGRESSDDEGSGSESKPIDSSTFGHEFYVVGEGPIKLEKGMLFGDVNKFREVLKEYTIQQGCKIIRDKNERGRVTCHCAALGCQWRVHASLLPDGLTYKIRSYKGEHTCLRSTTSVEANSTWIAKKFASTLRTNPTMTLDAMQVEVQQRFGIEASKIQLYRAKRKAMEEIEGNHGTSYAALPTYAAEVRKSNPGSLVKIQCYRVTPQSPPVFERIFVAFEAMKTGFSSGCRPFIGIDGCHLKGPFGGVLLAAIALDGNNGLFPIAVAVVESEGRESWGFFIDHLHTLIAGDAHGQPLTFMSDQQKSIDKVIGEIFPEASHRLCCRHLFNNFKKVHPGLLLKKYFWQAARAYTQLQWQQTMERIKSISVEAHTWLSKVPVTSWSRHAFDERLKNDHITNNLAESFNNWVGPLRFKPIMSLLEGIRTKVMTRLQKRHEKGMGWAGLVGPNIRKRLNKANMNARNCSLFFAGGWEHEILVDGMTYQLHIEHRRCSCREWQIAGIPCKHAVAAITHKRGNIEEWCDPAFMKETYLRAHAGMIHPIPDQRLWEPVEGDVLEPPPLRRLPGRPRKNRRKEVDEAAAGTSESRRSQTIKCSNCQNFGHNKRSCQRAPVAKKKPPQRPADNGITYQGHGTSTQVSDCVTQVEGFAPSRGRGSTCRGRGRAPRPTRGRGNTLGRGRGRGNTLGRGRATRPCTIANNGLQSHGSQSLTQVDSIRGRGRGISRGRGKGKGLGSVAPTSEYAQF